MKQKSKRKGTSKKYCPKDMNLQKAVQIAWIFSIKGI